MKENHNNYIIQKYLANELTVIERTKFKQLLKQDIQLAKELKLHLAVDQAISDSRLDNFKTYLESLHKRHLSGNLNTKSLGYSRHLPLVASLVIIITLGSLLIYDNYKKESVNNCFDEFYEPYDILTIKRTHSLHTGMNKDAFELIQLYNGRKFKKAERILTKYSLDICTNEELILMTGIIHLELDNFELAKNEFKRVLEGNDEFFKQEACWYLALTYLKANEVKEARIQLDAISKNNSFHSLSASKLLLNLK